MDNSINVNSYTIISISLTWYLCLIKEQYDIVFILIRLHDEYHVKGKMYMCFVDLRKAFDRLLRKVLNWALTKKGIQGCHFYLCEII